MLAVVVTVGGNTINPTLEVTAVAGAAAGAITAPASAPSGDAPVTASVPPAENGDRTFRWTVGGGATLVSGQGTNTITFRPGAAGLKLVTCTVNLRNLVNVPLRAYLVAAGTGAPVALTVNAGPGGGTYPAGPRVDVLAHPPAPGTEAASPHQLGASARAQWGSLSPHARHDRGRHAAHQRAHGGAHPCL